MTIAVLPLFTSAIADNPTDSAAGEITPTRWNNGHQITMATARLLGRTTASAGVAEELDSSAVRTFLNVANNAQPSQYTQNTAVSVNGLTNVDFINLAAEDVLIAFNGGTGTSGAITLSYSINNGGAWVSWGTLAAAAATHTGNVFITGLRRGSALLSAYINASSAAAITTSAIVSGKTTAVGQINGIRITRASAFTGGTISLDTRG